MRRVRGWIVLALALIAVETSAYAQGSLPAGFAKKVPQSVQDLQEIENHVQKLVERALSATVSLRIGNAYGSGVIIDREGHILTAGHVSGEANREATIILPDGKRLRGKTLGANNFIDSGMVVITDKADFPHLDMARSADLQRGQWCLSLGHPGGFKPGRPPVVRLGRMQFADNRAIMTDCVLVGGDSGGPLFDMHGRVIGIHSRIGSSVTANVHVPIDTYRDTWPKLAAGDIWGSPGPLFNGIKPAQSYLGLRAASDKMLLKIETVTPGSPADKAGLRANDVILKVDNLPVTTADDFADFLKARIPGARLNIQVRRGNDVMLLPVVLGKRAELNHANDSLRLHNHRAADPLPCLRAKQSRRVFASNPEFVQTFREVVQSANCSTVRVQCDGKDVCLGTIVTADGWILTKAHDLQRQNPLQARRWPRIRRSAHRRFMSRTIWRCCGSMRCS